jgi:hypothetical protein
VNELERIERLLLKVSAQLHVLGQRQELILALQEQILDALEPATTYPASTGVSISVTS